MSLEMQSSNAAQEDRPLKVCSYLSGINGVMRPQGT